MLKFDGDLSAAPYGTDLLILLEDGTIHMGKKTVTKRWLDWNVEGELEANLVGGWSPVGLFTDDVDPYESDVIGWCDLDEIEYAVI